MTASICWYRIAMSSNTLSLSQSFALRGANSALELRYQLMAQKRRGGLLGRLALFAGSAVGRFLCHELRSPNSLAHRKMPVNGSPDKMHRPMLCNVGTYSKKRR
jgi:hypothetical protein